MGEGQRQHLAASGRLIYKRKCLYLNVLHSNYDFRKAVSRILSTLITQGRESFVSAASTRDSFRIGGKRSGQLRSPQFGLALTGVFRSSALTLGAVGSYSTFSPLPPWFQHMVGTASVVCFLWHYPSGCLKAPPPACIRNGYAASRPSVFGLSSPGLHRKRFSAFPKSEQL